MKTVEIHLTAEHAKKIVPVKRFEFKLRVLRGFCI